MASSFDQAPYDYERMRPGYPEKLIQDMVELTGIPDSGKILEIGCGTGQATKPMIQRGYRMTCLDIGENLLTIARDKFNGSNSRFINASFEEWSPDDTYDLVMSATAWHWIDPSIGYRKAWEVLTDEGSLALLWNKHPTPYTGFFDEVQEVYDRVKPRKMSRTPDTSDWIQEQKDSIIECGYFSDVEVHEYNWSVRFSRDEYISLLNTFSDHRALQEESRMELYSGISDIIDSKYNGFVDRPYVSILFTTKKLRK